jgi:hypothetical protein
MSKYSRERYLKNRDKIPKKGKICALCGEELPRFSERKSRKFCSIEHFKEYQKKYKKEWQKNHPENVKKWKKKYNLKNHKPKQTKKHVYKSNKTKEFQKIRGTGAFPE